MIATDDQRDDEQETECTGDSREGGQLVPYRVRPYRGESGFVAHTWLRSYASAPAVRRIEADEYYKQHARVISRLIDHSVVLLAEHREHEGLLLGHVVGERDSFGCVIHYVYVKGAYRRTGIGAALWGALLDELTIRGGRGTVRFTHARNPFSEIAARQGWKYSPYPAFRHGLEG